ncbi:MAG: TetR/AcrR family transcriptional regulator [Solirubrobacterales bacterium]
MKEKTERRKIHLALIAVCLERGISKATCEQVVERAGLDRVAFARHFTDLDDCFAQYLVDVRDDLVERAKATATARDWRTRVRSVLYEIVRYLHADRDRAQMLLVESLAAGARGSLVREQALGELVALIDRGRQLMEDPDALTPVTAEALTGALFNQMHMLHESRQPVDPDRLVPQLMYFIVLPYLGREAAVEELSLPPVTADR